MPCYKTSKIIVVQQTLVYDIKEEKLILLAYFWHIQKHFTPSCTFIASFNIAKRLVVSTRKCMVPEKGIISPRYRNPYQGAQIYVYKYSNLDILKNRGLGLAQPLARHTHKSNYRYKQLSEHNNSTQFVGSFILFLDDTPYCEHAWKSFYCFPLLDFIFVLYSYYNCVVYDRNHTIHDFT